jgi:hypothetical protein
MLCARSMRRVPSGDFVFHVPYRICRNSIFGFRLILSFPNLLSFLDRIYRRDRGIRDTGG